MAGIGNPFLARRLLYGEGVKGKGISGVAGVPLFCFWLRPPGIEKRHLHDCKCRWTCCRIGAMVCMAGSLPVRQAGERR